MPAPSRNRARASILHWLSLPSLSVCGEPIRQPSQMQRKCLNKQSQPPPTLAVLAFRHPGFCGVAMHAVRICVMGWVSLRAAGCCESGAW